MQGKVWYTLALQGSKPSEDDADHVRLGDDDTIADLKLAVQERNTRTLAGIDPLYLEVFEYGETESRCKSRTKLNKCTSGSDEKPFSIFYPGTAAEPRFFKHIIHHALHATSIFCFHGDEIMSCV
jgi:hypothetical protein